MTTFNLPDLGEGLPEAEIVSWHVGEGDSVKTDDLLVSVETAKAVVEIPSPCTGVVEKLYASAGDIVATGAPLVDFSTASAGDTAAPPPAVDTTEKAATVVGNVPTGGELLQETAIAGGSRRHRKGRIKATPSVRTQAKRQGIDLADITATGKNGQITSADLNSYAAKGKVQARSRSTIPKVIAGRSDQLRGPRRAMAQSMSKFRDEVALCTLFDDADVHEWINKRNITARILRAIVAGCVAEPGLNGFYNADTMTRQAESRVDIAMAVDTEDGLIVPVIRNVEAMNIGDIRAAVKDLKQATRKRTVSPQDMVNYTFTLSNFGMMAGRYATPLMVPPTVGILGTGKLQHDVVAVMGGIEAHRRIPLSLSFDHRCITGGEAARFLAAVIQDLEMPE
jgi:2-oxoisovalerate dehydrogenase E2 component (dihydrolipoyl transacylase)